MRPQIVLTTTLFSLLSACDGQGGVSDPYAESPPTFAIVGRAPTPGRAGVPVTASIELTFSSNIDPASASFGSITLNGSGTGTIAVNGNLLKFTPGGPLVPGSSYAVATSPALRGLDGVLLGPTPAWGFKTAGLPPAPDTILAAQQRPR